MNWPDFIEFVQKFWLQFLLTAVSGGLTLYCKQLYSKAKEERKKREKEQAAESARQKILETAVCAMLHDRLLQSLLYFLRIKEITSDEMDNMKVMYDAYKALGGNGTIKLLWERFEKYVRIVPPDYLGHNNVN